MIKIIDAVYVAPLSVKLTFSDGFQRVVNIGEFIVKHPHPQYNSYMSENKFRKFKLEFGNIVWGKNWDLVFPVENLYKGILGM